MPIEDNDEIGLLARSYSALINQVDVGKARLVKANESLETLVKDRTNALEL